MVFDIPKFIDTAYKPNISRIIATYSNCYDRNMGCFPTKRYSAPLNDFFRFIQFAQVLGTPP